MSVPILVTGGAGYIGAHTCKALSSSGFLPVAFDNLTLGHRDFVRWGPLVEGDIGDASAVEEACRAHKVCAAIHFAAYASVPESVAEPQKYYQNNVVGTLRLLEGLRRAGVDTIVASSSCAVYGAPERQPIDEGTPTKPINPYGMTKLIVEGILQDYGKAYGLRWAALRYFNACGADEDQDLGEFRAAETHLIPRALMSLQGYIPDFRVYGNTFPTPDGTAIRDYIHVTDLADAHVAALKNLMATGTLGVLNLGTGQGYSVKEILAEIARITGSTIRLIPSEPRPGDPAILIADATLARERLGIRPSRSDLATIIGSAWRWHQKVHPRVREERSS
jgi:UDP-arabinose 4-epimerase